MITLRHVLPQNSVKVILLLAMLLLLCSVLFAKAEENPDYVKVYFPTVNQAELSILEKDYAKALAYYEEAFKAVPSPFAKDIYNAAVCATLVQDQKKTFEYLDKLLLKGVSLPYLQRQQAFDTLQTTKQWEKFAKSYPKRRRQYKRKVDLDIRADLDELYARDQYFRQAKGGLRVYGDTLRKIEASNVEALLKNIKKHGYPGESLIGVADTLEELPRFSLVIQRQNKLNKGHDFTDVLVQAVHEGKLRPHAAAYLIEQQNGRNLYRSKALVKVKCENPKDCSGKKKPKYIGRYLVEDLGKEEEERVNKLRAELGMEELSEYRKKVRYSLQDKRFKLGYTWAVANYYVPSKEAAQVITKGYVVAE